MRDTEKSWGYTARSGMRNTGRSMDDTERETGKYWMRDIR
jgi:hypothetical protein